VDDFESRRAAAQQPHRARDITAREDQAIAARRQGLDQLVEHAAQSGEALEGPQLEEFVEQERGRGGAGGARTREERESGVEGRPDTGRRRIAGGEGRGRDDRAQKPLRRGGRPLHVDVLRRRPADPVVKLPQQRRPAAAAPADEDRDAGRRGVERRHRTACQAGARRQHARSSAAGIRTP